jgi:serine/threonine-protein kinase
MDPTQLGPYVIRSRLGRGGMGAVYEAEDTTTGRLVAVKMLAAALGDDVTLRKRFAAEIETLKNLAHPGIVRLLAFGEQDGQPYYAMELVRGRTLDQALRGGRRFSCAETIGLALEITRALKSAHDHGVVHRDIKPANLLFMDQPADGVTVKLADFGIARLFSDAGHTQAGTIIGTAEYMAPEQAAGSSVDHRVDLYALGLVMFAMLAGRPPFQGGHVMEVIQRQRTEPPPRVSALVPNIVPELDDLIDRLLAKDPAKRPASALSLGRLLSAIDTSRPATEPAASERQPAAVDLFAPTLAIDAAAPERPLVIPSAATGKLVAPDAPTEAIGDRRPTSGDGRAHQLTETDGGDQAADRTMRNRFTTLEELHRATQAEAARARRREWLIRGVAAAAIGGLVVAGGSLLLRQPTADELHGRILAIAADEEADLRDAGQLIDLFLERHAADPRAAAIRSLATTLDLDALERRARRRPLGGRVLPPIERDYRAAMEREAESPAACSAALDAVLDVHAHAAEPGMPAAEHELWLALARRQIERLRPLVNRERAEDTARAKATLDQAAAIANGAATAIDPAKRAALEARRRELLESVVEIYGERPHMAAVVSRTKKLLSESQSTESPPSPAP